MRREDVRPAWSTAEARSAQSRRHVEPLCALRAYAVAVHALAVDTDDASLALRTKLSRTKVTQGGNAAGVARCKAIHQAAVGNAEELKDYLVTAGDLTSLKKRIDGFDALKTRPREKIATSSAVTKRLPRLFRQVATLLNSRIDKLMVKLKAAQPDFYGEYRASRVVVSAAARAKKAGKKAADPAAKAA